MVEVGVYIEFTFRAERQGAVIQTEGLKVGIAQVEIQVGFYLVLFRCAVTSQ